MDRIGKSTAEGTSARRWLLAYVGLAAGAFEVSHLVGPAAFLALPMFALLSWLLPDRQEAAVDPPLDGPPGVPRTYWLEDAYGSWSRGTHISTLAVRYEVEPELLQEELDRMHLAAQAVTLPAAGATLRRAAPAAWV